MMKLLKRRRSLTERQGMYGYLFCAPLLFGLVFMFIIPVCQTFVYSLHATAFSSEGIQLTWNNFDNFNQALFVDTHFREDVLIDIGNMLLNVFLVVVFSFFVATLLNQKFIGRSVVRAIFFLPLVMASSTLIDFDMGDFLQSAMGSAGSSFKNSDALSGAFQSTSIASILIESGIPTKFVDYLLSAADRIYEIVVLSGVQILIFLAALQSIPSALYEACDIEGATGWEKYWKITFPMVSPMLMLATIYTIIDSFTMSDTITTIQNKIFVDMKIGVSAAMSVIYFVLILLFVGAFYAILNKMVYYSDK